MTREEKMKMIWDKCMELAPNRMDMVKVNFNRTLKHLPKPSLEAKDFFVLISPKGSILYTLPNKMTAKMAAWEVNAFFSSLGLQVPKRISRTEQLLIDLEALKQLPDDTSATYIKGQITEATQRYYDTR